MKRNPFQETGFTLMELLIAVTIIGVVVILVTSALRISLRAWEKGEQDIEANQRLRAVIELMVDQLEAMFLDRKYEGKTENYYIKGDVNSMAFLTREASDPKYSTRIFHITYMIERVDTRKRLMIVEQEVPPVKLIDNASEEQEGDTSVVLIPSCYDVYFEYLKHPPDGEKRFWQASWNPLEEKGIPLAVRITIQEKEDDAPVRAIVRFFHDPSKPLQYR